MESRIGPEFSQSKWATATITAGGFPSEMGRLEFNTPREYLMRETIIWICRPGIGIACPHCAHLRAGSRFDGVFMGRQFPSVLGERLFDLHQPPVVVGEHLELLFGLGRRLAKEVARLVGSHHRHLGVLITKFNLNVLGQMAFFR